MTTFAMGLRFSILVIAAFVLLSANWAVALSVISTPTANFDGADLLLDFTLQLGTGPTAPLPAGTNVTVQFQDSVGNPIGGPVSLKVGTNGFVTVSRKQFPPGASSLGNQAVFHDITGNSQPVKWYDSRWTISLNPNVSPAIKIDPFGLPGFTSPQSWFINESNALLNGAPLLASNFDVTYTNQGGGAFTSAILGSNSFFLLGNQTYVDLPAGLNFGSLQYLFNDGITANGLFNFSAIGLNGTFLWDSSTDYASAVSTNIDSFHAPAITIVPEPPIGLLLVPMFLLINGRKLFPFVAKGWDNRSYASGIRVI
jgi:hypothetical protein